VVAAASSSSQSRAQDFLKKVRAPTSAKAYGSYAELVKDPNVDIIYVATPHSHHFQNTMLCLEAGKHVLCEKAFTVNAAQAKKLVETAKARNLFLMEAVWTRYFPLSVKVREMVMSGEIGQVHRVIADLSFENNAEDGSLAFDDSHRMVNLDLAGGALLDLGIYALTWNFQILYHCQPKPREAPKVTGVINKYEKTGADEMTSMILQFPKHKSMGIALTSLRVATDPDYQLDIGAAGAAIRIQGTKGEIQVMGPAFRPTRYRVIKKDAAGNGEVEEVTCPIPTDPDRNGDGHGMFWEADEAVRCIRDGKLESETLSWEESVIIMETMDEVREQGGLNYSDLIETAVFDAKSPLNVGNQ
jgi:predicted dehydrogenase